MNSRLSLAIISAKLISIITKTFWRGGGTAAPGLYALKICPDLIPQLSMRLKKGTIIVAGTNGKTTTTRMLATILKKADISYIHNREGSNLLRGFASTLAVNANFFQKPIADYALWEVDEATLPPLLDQVKPSVVILTNLFRDQLDRYGEVAKIRRDWENALAALPKETILILNADDPSLAYLGQKVNCTVIFYGITMPSQTTTVTTSADANFCPICNTPLRYSAIYYSHIGKYSCPNNDFRQPRIDFSASNIDLTLQQTTFVFQPDMAKLTLPLPGIYNIYNAVAAMAGGKALAIKTPVMTNSIASFSSAFGRVEEISLGQTTLKLFLVKNPTGFNEVLHTLCLHKAHYSTIVIGINDNFADGTDVSWLWDVNFEELNGMADKIICAGVRAYDIATRLKYANVSNVSVCETMHEVLDMVDSDDQEEIIILPTYTVMLELRKLLAKKGFVKHYLDEETA